MLKKRRVLIFIENLDLFKKDKIIDRFQLSDDLIQFIVFDNINGYFIIDETGEIINKDISLESILITSDFVINFLSLLDEYKKVQKKIEDLKINYFGNSLSDIDIFSEKNNIKIILEKNNFLTPVFEKINNRDALELFSDFPQPSRIFSKNNNFFSDKLESIKDIDNILNQFNNLDNFYIEKYIEAPNYYTFVYKDLNDNILLFSIQEGKGRVDNVELNKKALNLFNLIKPNKFILLHTKINNDKIYFLNLFMKNDIFINNSNIDLIFDEYHLKNLNML